MHIKYTYTLSLCLFSCYIFGADQLPAALTLGTKEHCLYALTEHNKAHERYTKLTTELAAAQDDISTTKDMLSKAGYAYIHRRVNYDALLASSSSGIITPSYFSLEAETLKQKINNIFHPIIHGCAEPLQEGLFQKFKNKMSSVGTNLRSGNFSDAMKELAACKDSSFARKTLKTIAIAAVEKHSRRLSSTLFRSGIYNDESTEATEDSSDAGCSSQQALLDAEENPHMAFPNWNPAVLCPEGIHRCRQLGPQSKAMLSAIDAFIQNILDYEGKKGLDFFSNKNETNKVLHILHAALKRMSELNMKATLSKLTNPTKPIAIIDDKELKSCVKVIESLMAIPTEYHDIDAVWEENKEKIDELLSILPQRECDELYGYMSELVIRSKDPDYGHKDGDSGTHLLFAGPSGSGKTFIAKKIIELLGYPLIIMQLKELLAVTPNANVERLLQKGTLSELEQKILHLQPGSSKGTCPASPIIFIDEIDEDRIETISSLKDKLCQFKSLYLPTLGITTRGFLNCIFTTNNTKLMAADPALAGRILQINFPPMSTESKLRIIFDKLKAKFKHNAILKDAFTDEDIFVITKEFVMFNEKINSRILLANVDNAVVHFVTTKGAERGALHRVQPSRRRGNLETFSEFLTRKFGAESHEASSHYSPCPPPPSSSCPASSSSSCHASSSDDDVSEDSTSSDD